MPELSEWVCHKNGLIWHARWNVSCINDTRCTYSPRNPNGVTRGQIGWRTLRGATSGVRHHSMASYILQESWVKMWKALGRVLCFEEESCSESKSKDELQMFFIKCWQDVWAPFFIWGKNKSEPRSCRSIQQKHPRSWVFVNLIQTAAWKSGSFHIVGDEKYDHITSCQVCVFWPYNFYKVDFLLAICQCKSYSCAGYGEMTKPLQWWQGYQIPRVINITLTVTLPKVTSPGPRSFTQFTKSYQVSFIKSLKILLLQINCLTQVTSRRTAEVIKGFLYIFS